MLTKQKGRALSEASNKEVIGHCNSSCLSYDLSFDPSPCQSKKTFEAISSKLRSVDCFISSFPLGTHTHTSDKLKLAGMNSKQLGPTCPVREGIKMARDNQNLGRRELLKLTLKMDKKYFHHVIVECKNFTSSIMCEILFKNVARICITL